MALQIYTFPDGARLRQVADLKVRARTLNSPIMRYFPTEGIRSNWVEWYQKDNYGGLMQLRGLNGQPPLVSAPGEKKYIAKPAVYGERMEVDEVEMTLRMDRARPGEVVDLNDLALRRQDQLIGRGFDRIEQSCWDVAINGMFAYYDPAGVLVHATAYPTQRYVAPTPWSNRTLAAPLEDLSNVRNYSPGMGIRWDASANLFINSTTATHMSRNHNDDDLGGKRVNGGNTIAYPDLNKILTGDDLPNVVVYDGGYFAGPVNGPWTWTKWIPDGKGVVFGNLENGETIGAYLFTINANNEGGAPAPYYKIKNNLDETPPSLRVDHGFNGGPAIFYPSAIIVMENLIAA